MIYSRDILARTKGIGYNVFSLDEGYRIEI